MTSASITRTTLLLGAATAASRVVGYGRTLLLAALFGASGAIDPFFAAFRLPDLLFALSAAGSLSAGLVPVVAGLRGRGEEARAHRVAISAGAVVVGVTALCAALGVLAAEQIAPLAAPGFAGAAREEMIALTRLLFLSPLLLGISAVAAALLSAHERFGAQAAAPLLYNAAIIVAAIAGGLAWGGVGLAIGVVVGAALHALVHLLALRRAGIAPAVQIDLADPETRRALRLLLPRAFSIGALQIVGAVVVAVASRGTPGTVTAYTIAFSLASLPVAIIGTSIGTALLPRVARLRGAGDHGTGARESAAGLQGALPLLIGAAIGLACYAPEAASVVLLGASASGALLITALPLIAPAAISYGLLAIIVRLRFAADDGRTPLIAAIGGMLVAVAVAPLVPPESAALLLSCSGAAQLALLLLVERDRTSGLSIVGALRAPRLWRTALAVAAPALLASALDLPRPSLVLALIAAGAATASLLWRR